MLSQYQRDALGLDDWYGSSEGEYSPRSVTSEEDSTSTNSTFYTEYINSEEMDRDGGVQERMDDFDENWRINAGYENQHLPENLENQMIAVSNEILNRNGFGHYRNFNPREFGYSQAQFNEDHQALVLQVLADRENQRANHFRCFIHNTKFQ